ncbi:TPA: hypothetical protein ACS78C_003680 [Providencia alcalifaciens]
MFRGGGDKALEAVKMKKGDAAELDENTLKETSWLPCCFFDVKAEIHHTANF